MPQTSPQQKTKGAEEILTAISNMLTGLQEATNKPPSPLPQGTGPVSPTPTISFDPRGSATALPTGAPPSRPQFPMTGSQSIGSFPTKTAATNAGLVSLGNSLTGLFNTIEQKEHAKKSALAENYMLQINGLLASGDPGDRQKAMMILEDPKIRKALKTGLEYVPLEEEVPPEATGVQSALQKIAGGGKPGQPGQQSRRMQPILPQPSPQQQLQAAMTNAILQKVKQDPASALSMMGVSSLSAAEQHAAEFYEKGLGLSPAQVQTMSASEKLQGLKILEQATSAAIRGEIDMYKAQLGYKGKVDAQTIAGNAKRYAADAMADAWKSRTASAAQKNYAAGAKVYEDYAKKYLDIIKSGKGPDGKPLSADQMKMYQMKADAYQRQADEYLNQAGDEELMKMFMDAVGGEEPDATKPDNDEEPK